jgi:hypothetical protein
MLSRPPISGEVETIIVLDTNIVLDWLVFETVACQN